jgi:hypothetical protein
MGNLKEEKTKEICHQRKEASKVKKHHKNHIGVLGELIKTVYNMSISSFKLL